MSHLVCTDLKKGRHGGVSLRKKTEKWYFKDNCVNS